MGRSRDPKPCGKKSENLREILPKSCHDRDICWELLQRSDLVEEYILSLWQFELLKYVKKPPKLSSFQPAFDDGLALG